MLTTHEKQLCRAAPRLGHILEGYGSPAEGLCPIAAVAVSRGARLYIHPETGRTTFLDFGPQAPAQGGLVERSRGVDIGIYAQAEKDVLAWVGVDCLACFARALTVYGPALFPTDEACDAGVAAGAAISATRGRVGMLVSATADAALSCLCGRAPAGLL